MTTEQDVNPAFATWKSATGPAKELALRELVKRLTGFANAICWQRLPDHKDEFEWIVQDSVWRAIRYSAKFRHEAQFSSWFYRIVLNGCNKFLRNYKERCETSLEEEMSVAPEGLDARVDLVNLLDGLEGQEHQLFRLVAEGEDWRTIGAKLGISSVAARVRWNRLKERLRAAT